MSGSLWHAGERAAQERAGVRDRMEQLAPRILRPFVGPEHVELLASIPWLWVTARDPDVLGPDAGPWTSPIVGPPGFVRAANPQLLRIDALPDPLDPLARRLGVGAVVGILGIDLEQRRRVRVNGTVALADEHGISVEVGQAFGNCSRHITARPRTAAVRERATAPRELDAREPLLRELLARADTTFLGSGTAASEPGGDQPLGFDVSHRGGPPGFVAIEASGRLRIPDYAGNQFFNTVGNLLVEPAIALSVPDFARSELLQITGTAQVPLEPTPDAPPSTERWIEIEPRRILHRRLGLPYRDGA